MTKRNIEVLTESPTEGASLVSLYDDALVAVLLRTRASDHASLRLSCTRIRDIIDSVHFRKERSLQGFVEVEMRLLSPFEQYQQAKKKKGCKGPFSERDKEFRDDYDEIGYCEVLNDYSFETDSFRIFVDGRPMHKLKPEEEGQFKLHVRLLLFQAPFWEVCSMYDQDLRDLGTTLFTNKCYPKVDSLKKELEGPAFTHLLYIQDFRIPFEYRSTESTVGPLLIKKVLQIFDDRYTFVIYSPSPKTQYTKEDAEAQKGKEKGIDDDEEEDSEDEDEDEKILTDEDIQEAEEESERQEALMHQDMRQFFRAGFRQVDDSSVVESGYNYVFRFWTDTDNPILSVEETMNKPIVRKTPLRPAARGLARELRLLVEKVINTDWSDMDETECEAFEAAVREEQKVIYETSGNPLQLVLDSDVVHLAAVRNNFALLGMLLDPLPPSEKSKAFNGLDRHGLSPLMSVVRVSPLCGLTECRQIIETLISMGADKNIIHASLGLSAVGYLHRNMKHSLFAFLLFGSWGPSAEQKEEIMRIEALLRPANGPTPADKAIMEADDDPDSDSDWS